MRAAPGRRLLGAALMAICHAWPATARSDAMDLSRPAPQETCMYCHGAEGRVDTPDIPQIAAQNPLYLLTQLRAYRTGARLDPGRYMLSATMLLNDGELKRAADYFAGLPAPKPARLAPNDRTPGARLYWQGRAGLVACVACHPPADDRLAFDYPRLTGLNAGYLATQLRAYRSGKRRTDRFAVMRRISARLSDRDIDEVAAYLGSKTRVGRR
jgi:cytochrome c553